METIKILVDVNKDAVEVPYNNQTMVSYLEEPCISYVNTALDESILEAGSPNTKRFTHADVMASLRKQRLARSNV